MRFAFVGAGAVGGYYGALLARAGHAVTFVARGAHLDAIQKSGLRIISDAVGDFTQRVTAEHDAARIGAVDVAVLTVKTYDNDTALPLLARLVGPGTTALTLQNGVDSAGEVAAAVGEPRTLAGATYIATAIDAPGVIRQTGSHRRVVFGECFNPPPVATPRVMAIHEVLNSADIQSEPVADARTALWEKFVYLAPFAAFTGASRLSIGPLWADADSRSALLAAFGEVAALARASGIGMPDDVVDRIQAYTTRIPAATRSSLLIDLTRGRRLELESLAGSVVRRAVAVGVPTPIMRTLYAVLKPYASGRPDDERPSR